MPNTFKDFTDMPLVLAKRQWMRSAKAWRLFFSLPAYKPYKQGQGTVSQSLKAMEARIGEVADNLSKITERLFSKTDTLAERIADQELKIERVEAICQERHATAPLHHPGTGFSVASPWFNKGGDE